MVWVVCSGVIPPYNSGGGGGRCSNAPCQNEQYFVACGVCLFLPRTIFGDCRLS